MRRKSAKKLEAKWESCDWCRRPSGAPGEPRHPHDDLNLRLRRALSWLKRAEKEHKVEDFDAAFIFYWIAFNATYGRLRASLEETERARWSAYLGKIVALVGSKSVIDDALWRVLQSKFKRIFENRYVYESYWTHRNNPAEARNWEDDFHRDRESAKQAIDERRTEDVLCKLFGRLYTLRNQLLHGGATWEGSVNRNQVKSGARIMSSLVPHFIDIMIEYPDADWGPPHYPVVRESEPLSGLLDVK